MRKIAERRPARARARPLPVAASAGAHLIVFTLLIWRLGTAPELAQTPVMNVELTPLRRAPPERPVERRREHPTTARGLHALSPPIPHQTAVPDEKVAAAPLASGDGVQRTLRGLLGCQPAVLARLGPEERRRCEERLATAAAGDLGRGANRLNLDRRGEYARNPEVYLNRRPKNGCKPRAAGDADHMGREGPAAGVDCAWDF